MSSRPTARRRVLAIAVGALLALLGWALTADSRFVQVPAAVLLGGLLVSALLYLAWGGFRLFLWRVGRRLAFSYFLIGVLPIPMLGLLLALSGYLLAGYFMTTLHRDATSSLQTALAYTARASLDRWPEMPSPRDGFGVAYYRGEKWV
ncbi:MAG: hypothetical protein ACRD0X_07800, partial [Thermoanaerobaculia bacterium]